MNNEETIIGNKENELDLLVLIGMLFKHKIMIILITSISIIGILLFSLVSLKLPPEKSPLPNLFKPVSTVRINSSDSNGGMSSMLDSSGIGALASIIGVNGTGSASETAFAIKLSTSSTILDKIAKELNLKEVYNLVDSEHLKTDIRNIIIGNLSLEEDSETGTLSISYESIDRELATKLVNCVVDILEQRYAELAQTSNYSQKILLEQKIIDVNQEISYIKQQILNFQNKYDILDAKTLSNKIAERIVTLRTSLVEKEAAIATYMSRSRIQDPALVLLKDQKTAIENTLLALESGTITGIPSLKDLPIILMEYEELTRNLEIQATIYKTLIQQYELLKLQDGGTGPKFQIIEYAEIPEIKSGPSRGKLCIIVTFAAFFLSIFLAFLKEFWDNLKKDPERMNKLKGLG